LLISTSRISLRRRRHHSGWSQKRESLPRPSSMVANADIIELFYEASALPAPMKDTQIVKTKICDRYGVVADFM
jgi:hypothetical protein